MGHRMGKTCDPKRFSGRYRRNKVLIRNNTVTQVFVKHYGVCRVLGPLSYGIIHLDVLFMKTQLHIPPQPSCH